MNWIKTSKANQAAYSHPSIQKLIKQLPYLNLVPSNSALRSETVTLPVHLILYTTLVKWFRPHQYESSDFTLGVKPESTRRRKIM